jgi:hypothetical protein
VSSVQRRPSRRIDVLSDRVTEGDTREIVMSPLASMQHALYRMHQSVWSAWARRRYRSHFAEVEKFCLFVGYPRSGHSLVGAMLNAHRDAVIAHELNAPDWILAGCTREVLYSRILARAYWFNLRGNRSNHEYQIPNQWQGRFARLEIVGDKRAGAVTRAIASHPDFLERVRALIGVPLRLVHVVRNPFDNIAAISKWHDMSLEESVAYYFSHCETIGRLGAVTRPGEVLTVAHERLVQEPRRVLAELCAFLDLDAYEGYVDDCASVVFAAPTYTRRKTAWPPALVADVERRARSFPHLDGYRFDVGDDRFAAEG